MDKIRLSWCECLCEGDVSWLWELDWERFGLLWVKARENHHRGRWTFYTLPIIMCKPTSHSPGDTIRNVFMKHETTQFREAQWMVSPELLNMHALSRSQFSSKTTSSSSKGHFSFLFMFLFGVHMFQDWSTAAASAVSNLTYATWSSCEYLS